MELIVVLLVLGILAAIAVPTFNRVKENSVVRAAQTTLEAAARNGEAIAKSDPNASDAQIAALVESEFADANGLSVTVSGDTVTVTQTNGSFAAEGLVYFNNGVGTIIPVIPTIPTTPGAYAIGDVSPGGDIVFIAPATSGNSTGLYFEAAPSIDDTQAPWCSNTNTLLIGPIPYGTNFDIGTGVTNTSAAAATCTSGAIRIAADYSKNGLSDWFLPSSTELTEMRYYIGGAYGHYWTSTENVFHPGVAEAQHFSTNSEAGLNKPDSYYVRPVRSFS